MDAPNQGLEMIMEWMRMNKLKLNPDKTEVLMVGRNSSTGNVITPVLDEFVCPLKTHVSSLEVLLD